MKKRVEELQAAMQTAHRQQRHREREMRQVEALRGEIEEHKKHKASLSDTMSPFPLTPCL
jgi:hypothetical protein